MAQPGLVAPWRATYVPGEWYLIAGPTALVVIAPDGGRADMMADLWSDVVSSASMSDLVDRLAGYGITELPDLAVLFWSQAGMRTLVRGAVTLTDGNGGAPLATGAGIVTWNEVDLGELTRVRVGLGDQPAEGDLLPLAVGVVRVGAVAVSADDEAAVRSPQPLLRSAGRVAAPVAGSAGQPAEGEAEAVAGSGVVEPEHTAAEPAVGDDDTGPDFPPIDADAADEPSQTGESPVVALNSPWGPEATDDHPEAGAAGAVAAGAVAAGVAGSAAAGEGAAGAGAGAALAARGGEVSDPQFSLDQFAMENDDTQLVANPVIEGPTAGAGAGHGASGPMIEAVRCPAGHPNAPGSSVCRVCRRPIPPGPPQLLPAPLLARLRAADGTVVDLDRAILFGRAPSEQRQTAPLPRLVTLVSPAQDISRTHLQVIPDNWQVVATDLNSTNGTYVTDPGPNGNSGLLPPGQPVPVPIGATMELGEGVTITVEPVD